MPMLSIFSGPSRIIINAITNIKHVRGKKKYLYLIFSGIGVFLCCIIINYWTYVPTYTHILYFSHILSNDTTDMNFCTVDFDIRLYDGYVFYEVDGEKNEFSRKCMFHYERKRKNIGVKKASLITSESLNTYLGAPLFSNRKNTNMSYFPEAGNTGAFCHTFNTGNDDLIERISLSRAKMYYPDDDYNHHIGHLIQSLDEDTIVNMRDYLALRMRLPLFFSDKSSGRIIHSYAAFISDSTHTNPAIQQGLNKHDTKINKLIYQMKCFFSLHDVSRCNYYIYTASEGVDSINLHIGFHEDAEIVTTTSKPRKNYIESSYRCKDSEKGVKILSISAKMFESENTQLIRMFFISTICATCFGFFLKYLVLILTSIRIKRSK